MVIYLFQVITLIGNNIEGYNLIWGLILDLMHLEVFEVLKLLFLTANLYKSYSRLIGEPKYVKGF